MEMLKFQNMPYTRPDMEALTAAYAETTQRLKNAVSYAQAREAYFALQEKESQMGTLFSICSVRNTIDTTDPYYDGEIKWLREKSAALIPLRKAYREALASSPWRPDFEAEFGAQLFRMIDASLKTSDERLIPSVIREGELKQAYQKDSAMAVTEFRGEKCNFYGLLKHMESPDREERREAFHAWAALYESISSKLDAQYDELVALPTPRTTPPASGTRCAGSSPLLWRSCGNGSGSGWGWTSSASTTRSSCSQRATRTRREAWRSWWPRPRPCTGT